MTSVSKIKLVYWCANLKVFLIEIGTIKAIKRDSCNNHYHNCSLITFNTVPVPVAYSMQAS